MEKTLLWVKIIALATVSACMIASTVGMVVLYHKLPVYEPIWRAAMVETWPRIADSMEVHVAEISKMSGYMQGMNGNIVLMAGYMRGMSGNTDSLAREVHGMHTDISAELVRMNSTAGSMNAGVAEVVAAMGLMNASLGHMAVTIPREAAGMRQNMSPGGMMNNMFPRMR